MDSELCVNMDKNAQPKACLELHWMHIPQGSVQHAESPDYCDYCILFNTILADICSATGLQHIVQ